MDNREFKQMIKQHKVKQTFAIIHDDGISRIYISTDKLNESYHNFWSIENNKLIKSVSRLTPGDFEMYKQAYIEQCAKRKAESESARQEEVSWIEAALETAPMDLKKYYKVALETVKFQVKDSRYN